MSDVNGKVYIGTILLEPNRWAQVRTPTYRVSEWLGRFAEAGFDGVELWEYHATLASPSELASLEASPVPVAVFNTYCGFEDAAAGDRAKAVEMVRRLAAGGVKFNVGRDADRREEYLRNLRAWAGELPEGCRLLCECHGGTILEQPPVAAEFFREAGIGRLQGIVHCLAGVAGLGEWFDRLGPAITHAHVALRHDGRNARLSACPAAVAEALALMRRRGFAGSFTLEFTEGTREPGENIESLWQAALDDLAFLRRQLSLPVRLHGRTPCEALPDSLPPRNRG